MQNQTERVFFDGTIKCLKYLIKNKFLDLKNLPILTQDEKYLFRLLEKYSNRLDITDVILDIEEPTLRVMLIEYPHLISEVLEDNELASHLIGRAMVKNGITDLASFLEKVDDGKNSIEVDKDKNSKEAMKCKILYLGLMIKNRKMQIPRTATDIINEFTKLTDNVIENETYSRGIFNSMYAAFYGSDYWNNERKAHLSGCNTLYLDFQLLFLSKNHMSMIYDIFLTKEVDKIGKKYFGDVYKQEGFIASLAIKMAIVIILFRAENFIPKDEVKDTDIFDGASMLNGLNYAVKKTGDKQNRLELKQWFLDYFRDELEKRVAFIKMQIDNVISIAEFPSGLTRVIYLPVFESFRFFCTKIPLEILEQIIKLFKNRKIDNEIKDDVLINFVINIQKIISNKKPNEKAISEEENYYKDAFIILISKIFENLIKKSIHSLELNCPVKTYYEKAYTERGNLKSDDLYGDANMAIIELILNFDLSANDSFIGYIESNLYWKLRTTGRLILKTDQQTISEINFKEGFMESIPDPKDFTKQLENEENIQKIRQYIDNLPEKEREAVKKRVLMNEKLTDTERRAKNRGLNKIRQIMGVS
ncbi:MAG: hypothetical protein ABIJ81_02815 [Patescibacteria group bacterium]